jgi:ribonucleoside-diphosphate reductase alpha chain
MTPNTPNNIVKDYARDNLFDPLGLARLRESYMREDEQSPQDRLAYVSNIFSSNPDHAQRLYDYSSKHWLSYSTPILSYGRSRNGLPISCFLSYLEDSAEGLVDTLSEVNWLSMLGGGVGIHVKIRQVDEKSTGVMPHLKVYDASSLAYRQGRTRRGSYAAFLDIDHPDILQFLEMRKHTGDQNYRTHNLHHGINISDKFMEHVRAAMLDPNHDDTWELISPNTQKVVSTISAKYLWMKILETRMLTGEPYLIFLDAANKKLPLWLQYKNLSIHGSNLCTEIFLPTGPDRTAVCCLSSVNLEYFDEWRTDSQFIPDIMEMLDNVLDFFISEAPPSVVRARYSALRERSVGLGALGFHAYLQKNLVPLESVAAISINRKMFKHIQTECKRADALLCELRGPCKDAQEAGVPRRFSHWTAIAPNASTSLIMGNTSPSIEPFRANVFRQDTLSGAYIQRNKFLQKWLADNLLDTEEIWASITANNGSVQHLVDELPQDVRDIFKTANEIDQTWLVELAAHRQEYIDQGQSLNLFFAPDTNIKYLHACHFLAWKAGLKSLYYCRSDKLRKADAVGTRIARQRIEEENKLIADKEAIHKLASAEEDVCIACEG